MNHDGPESNGLISPIFQRRRCSPFVSFLCISSSTNESPLAFQPVYLLGERIFAQNETDGRQRHYTPSALTTNTPTPCAPTPSTPTLSTLSSITRSTRWTSFHHQKPSFLWASATRRLLVWGSGLGLAYPCISSGVSDVIQLPF